MGASIPGVAASSRAVTSEGGHEVSEACDLGSKLFDL